MTQTELPLYPKTYTVNVFEELGGIIRLKANSEEEAQEIVEDLMNNYNLNDLFYPSYSDRSESILEYFKEKNVEWTKHYHGDRSVGDIEEEE